MFLEGRHRCHSKSSAFEGSSYDRMCFCNLHVLLQVQERNGVPVASEGVLTDVCDVVGAQVQVAQPVQWAQRLRGDLMQPIVSEPEVLQVF